LNIFKVLARAGHDKIMSHMARLEVDPENRIIMHNHATHLLAMSFTHDLDEKAFTRTLWHHRSHAAAIKLSAFPSFWQLSPRLFRLFQEQSTEDA
jgi:ribulose-5-phosphate 4-epimerase/fuculose-1-phosphate aldolase